MHNPSWIADWRGRRRYWEPIRWQRTSEGKVAIGLLRYLRPNNIDFENRWFLLFRSFNEGKIDAVPVFAQTVITSSPGSNQTITSNATWNNSNNSVELIAGASSGNSAAVASRSGGGGGAYTKIYNFQFANPGTTTAVVRVGAGGTGVNTNNVSVAGGDSWFNNTVYPVSGTGAGAKGGGVTSGSAGGPGGLASGAYTNPATGAVTRNGGNGFNGSSPWGGGGAGGPNGDGGNADTTFSGSADGGLVPGRSTIGVGASGTEFDPTHGCGAGSLGSANVGGLYGGASGGVSTAFTSSAGAQGIVVLSWGYSFDFITQAITNKRPRVAPSRLTGSSPIEAQLQAWVNFGTEIQSSPPPHPRPEKFGSIASVDQNWLAATTQPPPSIVWDDWQKIEQAYRAKRPDGSAGPVNVESPLFGFEEYGWEIPSPQPPKPASLSKYGSIAVGDTGNEALYIQWFNVGWEIQPPPPPHPRPERAGAVSPWSNIEGTKQAFQPYGWEIPSPQPPHRNVERAAATMPWVNIEATFSLFRPAGWEIQSPQPPHPAPERRGGTIARSEDGIEAIYSVWANGGWEVLDPIRPHPRPERAGSILFGDQGNEAQFVPPTTTVVALTEPPQTFNKRPNRLLTSWDDGNQRPFSVWVNAGSDQTASLTLHPKPERFAAIAPSVNIEVTYALFRPFSWIVQPLQPPHPRPERAGSIAPLVNIDAAYNVFISHGWPIQPPQPPQPRWKKAGAFASFSIIDATFVSWKNSGWEVYPVQPPHRAPERKYGALARGDDGVEAIYIMWRNAGWEVHPVQPPRLRTRGSILQHIVDLPPFITPVTTFAHSFGVIF